MSNAQWQKLLYETTQTVRDTDQHFSSACFENVPVKVKYYGSFLKNSFMILYVDEKPPFLSLLEAATKQHRQITCQTTSNGSASHV